MYLQFGKVIHTSNISCSSDSHKYFSPELKLSNVGKLNSAKFMQKFRVCVFVCACVCVGLCVCVCLCVCVLDAFYTIVERLV